MPVGDRKLRVSLQLRLLVHSVCQLSGSISSCLEVKGQTPPLQNPATRLHGPVLIKDLRTSEVFNMFSLLFYLILFTLLYLHFISLTSDYSGLTKFNAKDQNFSIKMHQTDWTFVVEFWHHHQCFQRRRSNTRNLQVSSKSFICRCNFSAGLCWVHVKNQLINWLIDYHTH